MDNKNHSGKEWIVINMEDRGIKKKFKKEVAKIELSYNPAIPHLDIYSPKIESRILRRYLYSQAFGSFIHYNQKAEAAQVPLVDE